MSEVTSYEVLECVRAAVAYDDAIRACANNPASMSRFWTAEGADLDRLYDDWIDRSRDPLAKLSPDTE